MHYIDGQTFTAWMLKSFARSGGMKIYHCIIMKQTPSGVIFHSMADREYALEVSRTYLQLDARC